MLAKSNLRFSLNKNVSEHVTVFMDGLNFLNSFWQFSHVNLNMINCETALLTLNTPGIRTLLVILLATTLPSAHVQRALPVYISAILF